VAGGGEASRYRFRDSVPEKDSLPNRKNRTFSNTRRFLAFLDLATRTAKEHFVVDFVIETLRLLGFEEGSTHVATHPALPLTISDKSGTVVRTDACLLDRYLTIVLLVVINDDILTGKADAEPRVIAAAIAAFQCNNRKRIDLGLDPLDTMTIPCIKMTGTRPTFYLVPVTEALSDAAISGQHPTTRTRVLCCPTTQHTR